ncbi:MAG: hypothetical protein AB7E47_07805 [Desulfovibrionaceae bacterium]
MWLELNILPICTNGQDFGGILRPGEQEIIFAKGWQGEEQGQVILTCHIRMLLNSKNFLAKLLKKWLLAI